MTVFSEQTIAVRYSLHECAPVAWFSDFSSCQRAYTGCIDMISGFWLITLKAWEVYPGLFAAFHLHFTLLDKLPCEKSLDFIISFKKKFVDTDTVLVFSVLAVQFFIYFFLRTVVVLGLPLLSIDETKLHIDKITLIENWVPSL